MCMPKCTGGVCPAAPAGATAIPTCEFSSTGKPPPDYCGLRCKNGEKCPTGTTREMPTGICATAKAMKKQDDSAPNPAGDKPRSCCSNFFDPRSLKQGTL